MSSQAKHFGFTEDRFVEEALERASIVGVLDAWAKECGGSHKLNSGCNADGTDRFIVWLQREATDDDDRSFGYLDGDEGDEQFYCDFEGPTADAARAAAAKWIEGGCK